MSVPCRLGGRGVLVTRPAAQAEPLCQLISAAGGVPVAFPTVEILPTADPDAARARLTEPWDIVIFVSRNAVEQALALIGNDPIGGPGGTRVAAVGRATARALSAAGMSAPLVPERGFDSEGLLALPALHEVQDRRILIVRGDGGRTLLAEELQRRGATVAYVEVYRRGLPTAEVGPLLPIWREQIGLLTATSNEVLDNLVQLVGPAGRNWLLSTPLAVIGERGATAAIKLGFRTVAVAEEASDQGMLEALCRLLLAPRRGR
ncbi:MAG: uroporphyrinogen-III synthase [Chromatiaceae bacterium]|nr:MAG: uroporphyrinogen-III synthase [Chromatiaceae bacterium]